MTVAIFLYAGLLGPFAEELVFRGVLFRALRARLPLVVAIVLSALAFALLHPYRAAIYRERRTCPANYPDGAAAVKEAPAGSFPV